jgi:hypothetical protein
MTVLFNLPKLLIAAPLFLLIKKLYSVNNISVVNKLCSLQY